MAHGPKWRKNGTKVANKWDLGSFLSIFFAVGIIFFSISDRGPFSFFSPFLPIFGFRPVLHSMPGAGGLTRNYRPELRTLFPLTAFKNARNPKFVQNLSQRLFLGVPVRGTKIWKICQNLKNGNFRTNFDNFFQIFVPLTGTPKNNRWDKFWTNLGFRAFLSAVRGKRVRKTWEASGRGQVWGYSCRKALVGLLLLRGTALLLSPNTPTLARSRLKLRNGQSTVGGPKWTKMDLFRPKWTKMHHFGPFWSCEC